MSPIEGKVDLAVQLHFALFNGAQGCTVVALELTLPAVCTSRTT